jgi:hypothetical protein
LAAESANRRQFKLYEPQATEIQKLSIYLIKKRRGSDCQKSIGYKVLTSINGRWVTQEFYVLAKETTTTFKFGSKILMALS